MTAWGRSGERTAEIARGAGRGCEARLRGRSRRGRGALHLVGGHLSRQREDARLGLLGALFVLLLGLALLRRRLPHEERVLVTAKRGGRPSGGESGGEAGGEAGVGAGVAGVRSRRVGSEWISIWGLFRTAAVAAESWWNPVITSGVGWARRQRRGGRAGREAAGRSRRDRTWR